MSSIRLHTRSLAGAILSGVAALLMGVALLVNRGHPDAESAARDLGRRIEVRLDILDTYVQTALEADPSDWLPLDGLPEDMVVYRYVEDTLQSWAHQFPLLSDDLRPRTVIQRLGDARSALSSPLTQVTDRLSFVNYGPKWFLVRLVKGEGFQLIAGLEMMNELRAGSMNGVNRRFSLADGYSLQPLSSGVGVPVHVRGAPLLKVTSEQLSDPERHNGFLFWLSVLLGLVGSLLFLSGRPVWSRFSVVLLCQGAFLTWIYFYGQHLSRASQLFSPLLYADGPFLYSLGAVVVVNLAVTVLTLSLFLMRFTLLKEIRRPRGDWTSALALLVAVFVAICISAYTHMAFRSILINSGICLELYKVPLLTGYTAVVYLSFLLLVVTLPLLAQMVSPLVRRLTGLRYDSFSSRGRLVFSSLAAAYFVIAAAVLGLRKERSSVEAWAARLAMDRDISLEIQLRGAEQQIAADPVMGALAQLEGGGGLIRGRLVNAYMSRLSQDYDISAHIIGRDADSDGLLNDRIRGGVRLSEGSHFFYSSSSGGRARYTGFFTYFDPQNRPVSLLLLVESKHNREDRGYLSLMGVSEPGRISIPSRYSYAKYVGGKLVSYKGEYAYPTLVTGSLPQRDGYVHFVRELSEDEVVAISRPETVWVYYLVEGVLFALIAYALVSLLTLRRSRRQRLPRYFQTRISLVLYLSLIFTLVGMAAFSVWFVYRRNASDMRSIMVSRLNIIQSMTQDRLRELSAGGTVQLQEGRDAVERVGNSLHCDISLFDPSGALLCSTTPEVYERMVLGRRLDGRAYRDIVYGHQRFSILRERVGRRPFYDLHAPVFDGAGNLVALVSSPYTGNTVTLETDTVMHIVTILVAFILLLILARIVTMAVIARLFRPISEMREKMKVTDVDHLEPIEYTQEDEISPLVAAYNRMVEDLSESTRRLAQVERDKAWNDMARRVAHDIKNPLTPIKLQLQMLARMKASGNPRWQEKFDDVSATVLEHVDMLSDSADQFSTFAKLYDQQTEVLDLDELIRQEVALYDTREDVAMEYYGLSGALVSGPKPQLIRVIVNLLTNAMQAVDERSGPRRVELSLRNSVVDGFYDIVVEDNGPGVSEELRERIFTPDFTTKSSGSGLGLAICQKIVEHCGGEIFYSKSFSLGGACFTVRYPKLK